MRRTVIHIDRLVLGGIPAEQGNGVAAGLLAELRRVFADRETVARLQARGDMPQLHVAGLRMAHDADAEQCGASVASGIAVEMRK